MEAPSVGARVVASVLALAAGAAVARYRNIYMDSADYACLMAHHRGRRPRHKFRIRHYLDRRISAVEHKAKTASGMTVKLRHEVPFGTEVLDEEAQAFLTAQAPKSAASLHPSLRIDYGRITVVGAGSKERGTIDIGLTVSDAETQKELPNLVIVEIKQAHLRPRSPLLLALRRSRAQRLRISKYCTAACLLMPWLRLNRFAPVLRTAQRIDNG